MAARRAGHMLRLAGYPAHVVGAAPHCAEIPTPEGRAGRPTRHGCLMHQGLEQDAALSDSLLSTLPNVNENSRSTSEFGTPSSASGTRRPLQNLSRGFRAPPTAEASFLAE